MIHKIQVTMQDSSGLDYIVVSNNESLDDNLPYTLADMFIAVINRTNANPEMVIDCLKNEYDYKNEEE